MHTSENGIGIVPHIGMQMVTSNLYQFWYVFHTSFFCCEGSLGHGLLCVNLYCMHASSSLLEISQVL